MGQCQSRLALSCRTGPVSLFLEKLSHEIVRFEGRRFYNRIFEVVTQYFLRKREIASQAV